MNRRDFVTTLGIGAVALGMPKITLPFSDSPQIAITIDDFNLFRAPQSVAEKRNRALLAALRAHSNLKAGAFIAARHVDSETGKSLVREWGTAGHLIANHTYSHWYYHNRTFDEFANDVTRAEAVLKGLPGFTKFFRFPMLKEGDTLERRDKMRAFLKQRGYRMGYVTIDASDWYIDQRLRARLAANPKADLNGYRDYYLNHLWDRAIYYDGLSRRALGRSVKHTLLIHHNVLNELFLPDVLDMFKKKGWRLIDAANAFKDPIFSAAPNILPAGESIVWALAKESGKFEDVLRYPGEDGDYEKAKMDQLGL
ncbi:MAG: polysaccharide deacetylase family protein [Pyrinomonadaceae bacterium]